MPLYPNQMIDYNLQQQQMRQEFIQNLIRSILQRNQMQQEGAYQQGQLGNEQSRLQLEQEKWPTEKAQSEAYANYLRDTGEARLNPPVRIPTNVQEAEWLKRNNPELYAQLIKENPGIESQWYTGVEPSVSKVKTATDIAKGTAPFKGRSSSGSTSKDPSGASWNTIQTKHITALAQIDKDVQRMKDTSSPVDKGVPARLEAMKASRIRIEDARYFSEVALWTKRWGKKSPSDVPTPDQFKVGETKVVNGKTYKYVGNDKWQEQ
jgi:hypothetical protein